jgi:hypothetical protein
MRLELLAPRPPATPGEGGPGAGGPCDGGTYALTASGTYPPTNSQYTDASAVIYYGNSGGQPPRVPTPGFHHGWAFETYGSAGSPDYGESAYWVPGEEKTRMIVVGSGVATMTPASTGGAQNARATVWHFDGLTPVEDSHADGSTAGPIEVTVDASDGFCVHVIDLTLIGSVTSSNFGFAGATWVAGDTDAGTPLPPPPLAPVTALVDPTVTDDSYPVGTHWVNTVTPEEFVLTDNAAGAAVWTSTTAAGGTVTEILSIPTAETNTALVMAPDGAGGVEFRAEAGGALGSWGSRY